MRFMQKENFLYLLCLKVLRKLLSFFTKVSLHHSQAEALNLDPNRPTCYVLQQHSLSDFMLLEQQAIEADLPRPSAMLRLGEQRGTNRCCYVLPSAKMQINKKKKPEDATLRAMINYVLETSEDVQLVPVSIFWGRKPDQEKSLIKLLFDYNSNKVSGIWKLFVILLHGRNVMMYFDTPVSLRRYCDLERTKTKNLLPRKVNRLLRVHFRQLRKSVVGPELSHRKTLVDGLLRSPKIRKAIAKESSSNGKTVQKTIGLARKYAEEIVSDYRFPVLRFFDILLTWFWNKIYSGIKVTNSLQLRTLARNHAVIYTPCHRSHMDYLLISYVLYREGLSPPHIAAGINLNMPIVGSLLRRAGAFFIRRSFRGNPLYSAVFTEYLHLLFSRGFPVEYFIEGGRSRTGRLLKARTGMLAMTIESFRRNHDKPIVFVPIYLGYEKIFEGNVYLKELRGSRKKKETPFGLFRSFFALRKKYGSVYVNIGDPLYLREFLDQEYPKWVDNSAKVDWIRPATRDLAEEITTRINACVAVNPVNLVALALLAMPRQALSEESLLVMLDTFIQMLKEVPYSGQISLPESSGTEMLAQLEELDIVKRQSDSLGDIIFVEKKQAILLTYYRNNVQHLFVLPAFILCLFLNNLRVSRQQIIKLTLAIYPYLKAELFLRYNLEELEDVINLWLDTLVVMGLLSLVDNFYYRPGSNSVLFFRMTLISRIIIQTLERFYMVASLLVEYGSSKVNRVKLEKASRHMAQRLSILNGIDAPEFADPNLFQHFINKLLQEKLVWQDENGNLNFDHKLQDAMKYAKLALSSDVRHTIQHIIIQPEEGDRIPAN